MRTGRIEETTEANRVAAESALPGRAWRRSERTYEPRNASALADLARLLSGASPTPRSVVLAQAAELLGQWIEADRVAIYLVPGLAPVRADSASASEGAAGSAREDGLLLAASHVRRGRGAVALRRSQVAASLSPSPGWSRLPSTFQVPCTGPAGLLAMIRFDGAFPDAHAPQDLVDRAETAAALVAGYLERDRLEREVSALRAGQARSERLAALGRVASSTAHDLNNVLTAILGYADLLELELSGAGAGAGSPGRPELEEIRTSVARGALLVEDVLAFGRTRSQGEAEIDLADALARLDGMLRRVAGEGIDVSRRCEPGLPAVRLDRERFERMMLNLVANARHAIEACPGRAGQIEIALERIREEGSAPESGSLRLRVIDNGCGMRADVKSRVFEPFFTTRGRSGGTGLGLADAAELVREAGGHISIESTPGAGSAIQIELPTSLPAARPAARARLA